MSYSLFSEAGYLQDVASISGWLDLITAIDKITLVGPLHDFLNTGTTTEPQAVIKEINDILPSINDISTRNVLEGLVEGLKKVKEIGIISG